MAIKTRTPAAFGSSWSKHWLVPGLPLFAGTGNIYDWTNNPALWPWNCDCLGEWPTAWFLALASILDHWENEHVLLLLRWALAGSWPETSGGIWKRAARPWTLKLKLFGRLNHSLLLSLQLDAGNRERLYLRKNICAKSYLWCFFIISGLTDLLTDVPSGNHKLYKSNELLDRVFVCFRPTYWAETVRLNKASYFWNMKLMMFACIYSFEPSSRFLNRQTLRPN